MPNYSYPFDKFNNWMQLRGKTPLEEVHDYVSLTPEQSDCGTIDYDSSRFSCTPFNEGYYNNDHQGNRSGPFSPFNNYFRWFMACYSGGTRSASITFVDPQKLDAIWYAHVGHFCNIQFEITYVDGEKALIPAAFTRYSTQALFYPERTGGVKTVKFSENSGSDWTQLNRCLLLHKNGGPFFVKQNGKLLYWDGEASKWVEVGTQEKMIRLNTTTATNFAINLGDISISYTDYTLDFWLWIPNLSYSTLFSAGTGKSTNGYFNCCQIRNGQIEFTQICAGFGTSPDVSAPVHTGWNRITLVVQTNPASQAIYVDGVLSGSGSARSKSWSGMSWIAPLNASNAWGIANWQNGDYSKCHIYSLTTYKRALTTEEINSAQFPTPQDPIWVDVYKQWVSSDRTSTRLPEKKAGEAAFTIASDTYTTSLKDKPPFLQ